MSYLRALASHKLCMIMVTWVFLRVEMTFTGLCHRLRYCQPNKVDFNFMCFILSFTHCLLCIAFSS